MRNILQCSVNRFIGLCLWHMLVAAATAQEPPSADSAATTELDTAASIATDVIRLNDRRASEFTPPQIDVPAGFEVELVAAPPLVKHPMMACFDEHGRLFIAESRGRNLDKEQLLAERGRFIRMLEDTDEDGRFDKSTVFADKLVMPEGALWYRGALFVLSSPYLWRFEDTDGDGVADRRDRLVGTMEFNGKANQHGAYLGPNGRLYFSGGTFGYDLVGTDGSTPIKGNSAGVFSCRPDGSDVQLFGNGGINPVEVAFTAEGELITPCPIFDSINGRHDALIHWVRGALAGPTDYRPPVVKPTGYRLPALSRWGQVAPSGLTRYRGTAFGPGYRETFFTTLFNTATVVNTRIERMGASFRSFDRDFLTSPSEDFHPTDVLEDADGSLIVIDTGGWFRISCPESKTAKPKILGAIYRVRRTGAPSPDDPRGGRISWMSSGNAQLAKLLADPRPLVRDRAIDTLSLRGDGAIAALQSALDNRSPRARRNAIWALSRMRSPAATATLRRGLQDRDQTVRQAAARSAGVLGDEAAVARLTEMLTTDVAPLRRAAATALGQIGAATAVAELLGAAEGGGDDFLMHSLVYALIEIGDFNRTLAGLQSGNPIVQHAALMALDQIDPDRLTPQQIAPLLETGDARLRQAVLKLVASRKGWEEQNIALLEKWLATSQPSPTETAIARGVIATYSSSERVQELIRNALVSESTTATVRNVSLESIGRVASLPDAWVKPISGLLHRGDEKSALLAIHAITGLRTNKLDSELTRLAGDTTSPKLRGAALSSLASRGASLEENGFQLLLSRVISNGVPPFERLEIARALAEATLSAAQLSKVARALSQVGPLELPALTLAFRRLERPDAQLGEELVRGLQASAGTAALSSLQLRELFSAFPPVTRSAVAALVSKADVDDAKMAAHLGKIMEQLGDGNAEHGKVVFFSNRAACSACHRVAGEGGSIGPDLSNIGQVRTRQDLLESILYPSASIANNFETYSVITADGRIFQGVLGAGTAEHIVLRTARRQELVIDREDVEELARSKTSVMPQGLDKTIRIEELSDLIAYLQALKPLVQPPQNAQVR